MFDLDKVEFRRVRRSRHLRLNVGVDGRILLTRPFWVSLKAAKSFLQEKKPWLEKQLEKQAKRGPSLLAQGSKEEYALYKDRAYKIIKERLDFFNKKYNFRINRITIRNQRSRWGSCSKMGNLNFNYRAVFLSSSLLDYLVVHELCHLGELNHGPNFWKLVSESLPDYRLLRQELRGL